MCGGCSNLNLGLEPALVLGEAVAQEQGGNGDQESQYQYGSQDGAPSPSPGTGPPSLWLRPVCVVVNEGPLQFDAGSHGPLAVRTAGV
jgi:hypothetical protein